MRLVTVETSRQRLPLAMRRMVAGVAIVEGQAYMLATNGEAYSLRTGTRVGDSRFALSETDRKAIVTEALLTGLEALPAPPRVPSDDWTSWNPDRATVRPNGG